jgi:methionyl-tRNA formyltransferase
VTGGPAGADRVRTVFLGSGAFAVPALRLLALDPAIALAGVVTAPPRPVGRRQVPTATPVGQAAAYLGLEPVLTPIRLRAPEAIAAVLELQPDLAVLADYGQIVPGPLLALPHGALNLHPSLLPRWRGASPIPATIRAGDPVTGVSLMRMDEGLDTGPVVAQQRVTLVGDETAPVLESRLADVAADLLVRSLGGWLDGTLPAVPQPVEGATLTRALRREDGRLDPGRSAAELERQVRAYLPWPGSFVEVDGERLVVTSASVAPSQPADVPGRLAASDGKPALVTAAGRLVLELVTPPGRRPMSGADYLRGRRPAGPMSESAR